MSLATAPRTDVELDIVAAGAQNGAEVLDALGVTPTAGLSTAEVGTRRAVWGPNAVSSHRARFLPVLGHQLRSPLLGLLLAAALASFFVGERSDAVIIAIIVGLSIGLGFVNEYRAEKAAEALHDQIHHEAVVIRDGRPTRVDVTELVPGDIIDLRLGDIVPADVRLLEVAGLECDESLLTGESLPASKNHEATAAHTALAELSGGALMGTVVHAGTAKGVVVSTAARTEFGAIAAGLSTHQLDTEFQIGLRKFSMLLVYVGGALTTSIFVINVVLDKPVMDALLFSLAIAVGITPQLLPAVVSTSLAAGSRRMSRRKVLVKRLVCIEDLGNVSTLFTDKTGTLTLGRIDFMRALATGGADDPGPIRRWGLLCTDDPSQRADAAANPLDEALWNSPTTAADRAGLQGFTRLAVLPFDHERRMNSVLLRDGTSRLTQVTKGAPESVLERCVKVSDADRAALAAEFRAGNRVIAVATRACEEGATLTASDERDLHLEGLLVFLDPPKRDAAESLQRLADLGITVKVVTGDNGAVAEKVCRDLGLPAGAALTGTDLAGLDDEKLAGVIAATTVFARVSPEDKARIVRVQRRTGDGVAFLGDG
ncbi:MAG: HAD-IC family P-type ATPase, partial [Terracoccus sp.]